MDRLCLLHPQVFHDFVRNWLPVFAHILGTRKRKHEGLVFEYEILNVHISGYGVTKLLLASVSADAGFKFKIDIVLLADHARSFFNHIQTIIKILET